MEAGALRSCLFVMEKPRLSIGIRFTIFSVVMFLCFVWMASAAQAAINTQMSFQGKVANKNGTNVSDGSYSFTFKIYSVASEGSAIWTETKNIAVTDGIFQTYLGDATALPGSIDFNSNSLYLGVEFNSDGEMTPRMRLSAVPYAFNAQKVAGLTVTDTTGTLTIPNATTIEFSGANNLTFTTTGATAVTLPASGTLSTIAGTETLTNKTIGDTGLVYSGAATDIDTAASEALVLQGRAASTFQTTSGSITLQPGGSGTTSVVAIGAGGAGSGTPDFLALDIKSSTGDPAGGAVGYMYYNLADGKFRCYQASGWMDCIGGGGAQTPWSSQIDADGNNLIGLANVLFDETSSAPAGTDVGLYRDNSGDLNVNVLNTKAFIIQIDGTDQYSFSASTLDAGSRNLQTTGSILGNSIDRSSAGTLDIGNTNTTIVSLCNSANCDTIQIGTNADADTIQIGDASDSLTITSSTFTLNAGALSGITTIASSGDWTWTATSPTITINTDETLEITDGSGAFKFHTDSGPEFTGTARPTRQIGLSPEYAGAALVGDGSSNTGVMTSDFCKNSVSMDIPDTNTGVCNTSGDVHTYYQWTTSQGTPQDYDIYLRWRVPDNFSAWAASNPMQIYGKRSSATNTGVIVYVYDTAGVLENSGGTQVAGTNWTQTSVEASFAGTYTPGSYMTIRIVMQADTSQTVHVGEISMEYLGKN